MVSWWTDSGEATFEDLANKTQSIMGSHGVRPKTATNVDGQKTEAVRRTNKRPKKKWRQCRVKAVQDRGTPSSSDKNGHYSPIMAQVVSQAASVFSSRDNNLDSSFMDSGIYWIVCYSGNDVTPKCRHLTDSTQFIKARSWNSEALFEMEGDHRRQTPYRPVITLYPTKSSRSTKDLQREFIL